MRAMVERRQYERIENIKFKALVYGRPTGGGRNAYDIVNLSLGGVLIRCPEEFGANELVSVSLDCNEIGLECAVVLKAIVVRAVPGKDGFNVALKFINTSRKDAAQLKRILKFHKQQGS